VIVAALFTKLDPAFMANHSTVFVGGKFVIYALLKTVIVLLILFKFTFFFWNVFRSLLLILPAGPCIPCGLRDPVEPVVPVSPFKPVAPVAPMAPVSPFKPVAPVGPVGPVAPVSPFVPWIP
jgi:hypothetical protein